MWIKTLLFFVMTFQMSLSFAEICHQATSEEMNTKTIDLRSEMGPLRDQDSIGWCYGFTGADLLSHYLYKTQAREVVGPDKNADYRSRAYAVSGVGLSVFFNRRKNAQYFLNVEKVKSSSELAKKYKKNVVPETGSIDAAIRAAKSDGFCFEKDLPSENFGYVLDNRCAVKGKCDLGEMLKIVFDEAESGINCLPKPAIKKFFPLLTETRIRYILTFSERMSAIDRLAGAACKKQFKKHLFSENEPAIKYHTLNDPKSPRFKPEYEKHTVDELLKDINEALDRGTPVGIAYYSDFLVKENAGEGSPHASSLVGKRFNPETCEVEYILRNSWGAHCDLYNMENPKFANCTVETKKETDPKIIFAKMRKCREEFPPISRNPRVSCDPENGNAIVRKSDLKKYLYGITYIEEKL